MGRRPATSSTIAAALMHHTSARPDAAGWKAFCDADPACTYFQTPSWMDLITTLGLGWTNETVLLRFPHGVEAIVPRATRPVAGRLFRLAEAVPPGVYGGPLVRGGPLEPAHLAAVARLFRGFRAADAALTEVPGRPLDLGTRRQERTTHVLRLAAGETEQTLLARYRKGHRSDVLGARRAGVNASLARTDDEVEAYHAMYCETVARWQRTPYLTYPLALFRALHARATAGERVRIWLARHGAAVLAGAVVLVHGRHASYWHAASTEAGRQVHGGHLALHTAILDAMELGVEVFDFMPSAGLEAVERFKTGFSAEPVRLGVHHFPGSKPYRLLRWAKARTVRA
jgi:hypothetical protein